MDRRRFLRIAFTTIFVLFLLVLLFKFKPRVEVPPPAQPEKSVKATEGSLSTKGFRYVQETEGKVDYEVVAEEVTESQGGVRLLAKPVVTIPGQGKTQGLKGSFNTDDKTFRVWDQAHVDHVNGWRADSTGFRMTPEGEIVSEGPVTLRREDVSGSAQLLRFDRPSGRAHLEGDVRFTRGVQAMACRIIDMDLKAHTGIMAGPVRLDSERGTITAPAGTLKLDDQNRIETVTLGSPCTGAGPTAGFTAHDLVAHMGTGGEITAIDLEKDVVLTSPGPPEGRVNTDRVRLTPAEGSAWTWAAPGALAMARGEATATAVSGTGRLGGSTPETADLAGPVKGRDARGTFAGDRALLAGGDWTLAGHAEAVRPEEQVAARRLTWRKDGSSLAEGDVSGARREAGQPPMTYTAARADAGPGGYPARLEGGAKVIRGETTVTAPTITVSDERTAVAEGGATAVSKSAAGETYTVKAATVRYEGAKRLMTAQGTASGEGKDYTVTADTLVAHLDEQERPKTYEASGGAHLTGPLYDATGDVLTYDPALQGGQARGSGRDAVVVEKSPYRRLAGPVVDFAPRHIEVPATGTPRRGSLEGVQTPAPKSPAQEKGAHGK